MSRKYNVFPGSKFLVHYFFLWREYILMCKELISINSLWTVIFCPLWWLARDQNYIAHVFAIPLSPGKWNISANVTHGSFCCFSSQWQDKEEPNMCDRGSLTVSASWPDYLISLIVGWRKDGLRQGRKWGKPGHLGSGQKKQEGLCPT